MLNQEKIRCVNIKTGLVKWLVPQIANNPIRLVSMGFRKEELPTGLPSIITEQKIEETKEVEEIKSTEEKPKRIRKQK